MYRVELTRSVPISAQETSRWDAISRRMSVPSHDDATIREFDGYETLKELDWQAYAPRR
jgi:trehalose/maltose hydrolase-like predicted phosphorylase